MKYIGPVASEEVQSAYMPVTAYVDDSGFNPDDMRHPRWCHPVVPEDRSPGELEAVLTDRGIPFEHFGGIDGIRASFDSTLLWVRGMYIPRWPDKDGVHGFGFAPQYAIRRDGARRTLTEILALDALQRDAPKPDGWRLGDEKWVAT